MPAGVFDGKASTAGRDARPTIQIFSQFLSRIATMDRAFYNTFVPLHKKTQLTNILPPREKAVAVGIYTTIAFTEMEGGTIP